MAADAVAAALRLARDDMPEASASRVLLLIVGQAAACLGRLGVNSQDVLTVTWGYHEHGYNELLALGDDSPRLAVDS